ncbi:MAG: DUF935 family protein [Bacteroidia bacterium]|nr:DUF935 family protein [Bacteroidia bacterium]
MYIDTKLNGHVQACMERRKDLTLLRDWQITDEKGNLDEATTAMLTQKWFSTYIDLTTDALFFGYTLISLGDVINGKFKDIQTIRRWNVSPDRMVVMNVPYNPTGVDFRDKEYYNWHVFVGTPNDIGTSTCGYGLLYNVGILEIFLRNILGYNGDFVEMYSQPYRIGKTHKTEEAERNEFTQSVANMGSSGWMVTDTDGDTVEFLESALGGTGWQGYENFEQRIEKKISKIILGHADALDSVSGTLGATQGEESPTATALKDKQTKDGNFVADNINSELLPRLKNLGFKIPDGARFEFKNDSEISENNNKLTALAVEIKKAGLQMDKDYFEEQTGVKLSNPVVAPIATPKQTIENRIKNLYK